MLGKKFYLHLELAPVVVEVDESYFFHRKFHRGRRRNGSWVFGMVERGTGNCWLEIVPRRNAATLEPIMINHLLPGTVVMSDAWGGYVNVGTMNNGVYMHEVVVHAHNFVDPLRPDVHTQSIEGLWMQVKRSRNTSSVFDKSNQLHMSCTDRQLRIG